MRIAVFGLGEAGTLIAQDLARAGVEVYGYDPADVTTPQGVNRVVNPNDAVVDTEVILGITAQADAKTALTQAMDSIRPGSLYADLSTSSPSLKKDLADIADQRGILFVDIALLSIVPGKGMYTPSLASGAGAEQYVSRFAQLGIPVEAISDVPGDAATRKLLRSVMMKGLASLVVEAMSAGHAAGCEKWLWENLAEQLTLADEKVLARLITGTQTHALRRLHEMEVTCALLEELGVDPIMTRSTVESHKRVQKDGVPSVPDKELDKSGN